MEKHMWLVFAVLAGLAWGTYVPLVQQGIAGLGQKAYASFLCVGVAYFLIAILFPLGVFAVDPATTLPEKWTPYGVTFATLAGVAGAVGALCVILANRAAINAYGLREAGAFRMYIAPVIFALAPVLNTLISLMWHPKFSVAGSEPFNFHFEMPNLKLLVGIVLVGAGAALVLYSKEEAEHSKKAGGPPPTAPSAGIQAAPNQQPT